MTATTDPPKPKPAAKNAPAQPADAAPASTPKKNEPRPYRISKTLTLDLTDPMSVAQQLQSIAGGDSDDLQPVVVDVRVGVGRGINPKLALDDFGASNDMDGDYAAVAENSVKEFRNVQTKVKRSVSFD